MPAWVTPLVIAVAAIVVIVLLTERVAPGWWLPGWSPRTAPRRRPSEKRRLISLIALVLAVVVLAGILYYVFTLPTPHEPSRGRAAVPVPQAGAVPATAVRPTSKAPRNGRANTSGGR